MNQTDFPIEFRNEVEVTDSDIDFYVELEDRLRELARGHRDITGAAASLEKPAEGRETPPLYEASVVVYIRPNNIAAVEKADEPLKALQGALDAVERQVREQRGRLRNY